MRAVRAAHGSRVRYVAIGFIDAFTGLHRPAATRAPQHRRGPESRVIFAAPDPESGNRQTRMQRVIDGRAGVGSLPGRPSTRPKPNRFPDPTAGRPIPSRPAKTPPMPRIMDIQRGGPEAGATLRPVDRRGRVP